MESMNHISISRTDKVLGNLKFMLIMSLISIVLGLIFSLLAGLLGVDYVSDNTMVQNKSQKVLFILVVFGSPLIETFVFQFLIIEAGFLFFMLKGEKKFTDSMIGITIVLGLSSFLFAWSHNFNLMYFFNALFAGLILAYGYYYSKVRFKSGFITTCLIHANTNLFAFIYNFYL